MTKARHDVYECCAKAIEVLKEVGFERAAVALRTESTYWRWPGRKAVLRVSVHQTKRPTIGLDPIAAKLTFRGNCHAGAGILACSPEKIDTMIRLAIGQYMVNSAKEQRPTYNGPKEASQSLPSMTCSAID